MILEFYNLILKAMQESKPQKEEVQQQSQINDQQDQGTFLKIVQYLETKLIPFEIIEHQATRTSKQSANIRNTPLEWGSKTMLIQGKQGKIYLLLYRANQKISWSKLKKLEFLGKKCKMCGQQTVKSLGVRPGGVPPFANLLGIKGLIDSKFTQTKQMAFNAGHKQKSITMSTKDFPIQQFLSYDLTD